MPCSTAKTSFQHPDSGMNDRHPFCVSQKGHCYVRVTEQTSVHAGLRRAAAVGSRNDSSSDSSTPQTYRSILDPGCEIATVLSRAVSFSSNRKRGVAALRQQDRIYACPLLYPEYDCESRYDTRLCADVFPLGSRRTQPRQSMMTARCGAKCCPVLLVVELIKGLVCVAPMASSLIR